VIVMGSQDYGGGSLIIYIPDHVMPHPVLLTDTGS
jgi:hypothetical protein